MQILLALTADPGIAEEADRPLEVRCRLRSAVPVALWTLRHRKLRYCLQVLVVYRRDDPTVLWYPRNLIVGR